MPKEYINPNSLFPSVPHGFSQIVVASGEEMAFISGQTAWDTRKKIISADNVLSYVPSRLSRDEYHLFTTGHHDLGKPVRYARKETIRIDVFLGHKLIAARVATPF